MSLYIDGRVDPAHRVIQREYRESEQCRKCGSFPQPKWVEEGAFYGPGVNGSLAEHELLYFHCNCGFYWTTPPRDSKQSEQQGLLVPPGYSLVRDIKMPATPAGYRIVREEDL